MASKCISKLAWPQPPSTSPNSLDYHLQVHLWVTRSRAANESPNSLDSGPQFRTIMASKFISQLARAQHPTSHNHGLQSISNLAQLRHPTASLSSLNHGLSVHFDTRSIKASYIAQSQPQSASPNLLDYGLRVHLCVQTIWASRCISILTWSWPPTACLSSHNRRRQVLLLLCTTTVCIQIGHMYIYSES